jgi:hypothetical protein
MPANQQFFEERAKEARFRLMVHVRATCWIALHHAGGAGVFAHAPLVPITERQRLELILVRCAFFTSERATWADVLLFLWRLHPHYRACVIGRERSMSPRAPRILHRFLYAYALGSWTSAATYLRLRSMARACDVSQAVSAIREYLVRATQDEPGYETDIDGPKRGLATPDRCGPDNFVAYVMRNYGLTPDQALDLPIALFNQLYREQMLSTEDGELAVFAPSDALLN